MRKLTIEKMRSLANEHGGKCLSELYAGADTNLHWRCGQRHEWPDIQLREGRWAIPDRAKHTVRPESIGAAISAPHPQHGPSNRGSKPLSGPLEKPGGILEAQYRSPQTPMSPGRILGSCLNRQLSKRGSQRLVRYAAMARAGIGPGFHGSGIKGAIRTSLSDPQRPHRCRAEDETILQFSQ